MKKIQNPAPPLQVAAKRNPLTVSLTIGIVGGGTLTQTQDNVRNIWNPDRELAGGALILYPIIEVSDPDSGTSYAPTATIDWYVDTQQAAWDATNEKGHVQSTTASDLYYLETTGSGSSATTTGRLVVRKNVSSTQPKRIICVVSFTDSARQETYVQEEQVALSCENRPDDFYTVSLLTPSAVYFRPMTDETSLRTIKAEARLGTEISTGCKFFWYLDDTLIPADGSMPVYQAANQPTGKGQGKDTIVLDMDFIDDATLTVRIGADSTATIPLAYTEQSCSLMWAWPRMELWPYCKGDKMVRDDETTKDYGSILRCDGTDADPAKRKEYLRQQWYTKAMTATSKTYRDWGEETTIAASVLRTAGAVNVDVSADLFLLGPYEIVTDASDNPVTVDGTSELVWGRT